MTTAALASPASSISEFSVIEHPQSPYDAAILVEAGSDDDEIVFSPRHADGHRPFSRPAIDSDDDFILIPSPRTSMPSALVGLALTVVPAPSQLPTDETLATPTGAGNSIASPAALPTPSSSGPPHRSQTGVAQRKLQPSPSLSQSTAVSATAQRRRRHKAAKHKRSPSASPLNASSAAESYPSPSPSPMRATAIAGTSRSHKQDQRGTAAKGSIAAPGHKTQPAIDRVAKLDRLAAECEGIGSRGVVVEVDDETTLYQAAVNYISSFLANPDAAATPRLPLLQALVVELGLCHPTAALPASIKAAKTLLRTKAHINVRDYIAARGKGVESLRKIMFPSRSQLLKDLRKRRVPLKWIKEHGLGMLLVHFG